MRSKILFVTTLLLLCFALFLVYVPREFIVPKIPPLSTMPKQFGQWYSRNDTIFDAPTLSVLRPTDYLMRTYVNSQGTPISLYIGYHDGSINAGPIHSPKNCLPSGGWEFKSIEDITLNAINTDINVVRAVLTKQGEDLTFYYWYQVRGNVITTDLDMKIAEFLGMFTHNRKDAAFIRIGLSLESKEAEIEAMQNFFQNAYPILKNHLPS